MPAKKIIYLIFIILLSVKSKDGLGHSVEEFFKTYARWINASGDQLQMELIESRITENVAKMRHGKAAKS